MEKSPTLSLASDEKHVAKTTRPLPYITDDAKEWRKELAEAMVRKGFGKVGNGIARGYGRGEKRPKNNNIKA